MSGIVRALAWLWRKFREPRAHFTVEPVLFVFMFASFLSYSAFQQLLRDLVCQHTPNCSLSHSPSSSDGSCSEPSAVEQHVQTETSHWILYVNLASGIPTILFSLLFGALSDQIGRKFFIVLPAVGSVINAAVMIQVVYMQTTLPIAYFLLGYVVWGCYGSFTVLNVAVYSYAADISGNSKRTFQIGVLESMTYLGATLSQVVGGVWIKYGHYAQLFWCILACFVAVVLYTVVFLPKSQFFTTQVHPRTSLQNNLRLPRPTCRLLFSNVLHNLLGFGKLFTSSWRIIALFVMFFVVEINFLGITDTVILYSLGPPLCWTSDWLGYFLALKAFLNGLGALFVLPLLVFCNVRDTTILIVGLISGAAGLVLMGLSTTTWIMFIGLSSLLLDSNSLCCSMLASPCSHESVLMCACALCLIICCCAHQIACSVCVFVLQCPVLQR